MQGPATQQAAGITAAAAYPLNLFWKSFLTYFFFVPNPHISGSGQQLKFLCIGSSYFIAI
jgi:hypothetical protein